MKTDNWNAPLSDEVVSHLASCLRAHRHWSLTDPSREGWRIASRDAHLLNQMFGRRNVEAAMNEAGFEADNFGWEVADYPPEARVNFAERMRLRWGVLRAVAASVSLRDITPVRLTLRKNA